MHIDGSVSNHNIVTPDHVEDLLPGEYFVGFGDKKREQLKFLPWKKYLFSLKNNQIPVLINGQIT
jgi:hypothetical protein